MNDCSSPTTIPNTEQGMAAISPKLNPRFVLREHQKLMGMLQYLIIKFTNKYNPQPLPLILVPLRPV